MELHKNLETLLYPNGRILAAMAVVPENESKWRAMRGGRIELIGSDYEIIITGDKNRMPYELIDPEGRLVAAHPQLSVLKPIAEQMAKERKEFEL